MPEFPLLKMIDVGGRQTPFAYPQHGTLLRGYVETGEENPLPVKDELVNKTLNELKETLESQELKVKNVKITNAIEVSNLPETQKVEITNQKESQDVEVTNQPEDYPDTAVKTELESIKGTQAEIISALQSTNENLLATNEHLNSVIKDDRLQSDTQITGSNAEEGILVKTKRDVRVVIADNLVIEANSTHTFPSIPELGGLESFSAMAVSSERTDVDWELRGIYYLVNGSPDMWNDNRVKGNRSVDITRIRDVVATQRIQFRITNNDDVPREFSLAVSFRY